MLANILEVYMTGDVIYKEIIYDSGTTEHTCIIGLSCD